MLKLQRVFKKTTIFKVFSLLSVLSTTTVYSTYFYQKLHIIYYFENI